MKDLVLYIHGKGGSAAECEHYRPLFPDCEVFGLDYQTFTPWETGAEIHTAVEKLKDEYENIILTSLETVRAFAEQHDAVLTVMENGEHWFHTAEQMRFLDDWIRK